jgi:tungstate transport system substrate-binding protein
MLRSVRRQMSAARAVLVGALVVLLAACGAPADRVLVLATTTSTQDSGLLDELLPVFTAETGWRVRTVAVGSGQAIELGRRGEADVLLVHSPAAEEELVAEGSTGRRLLVMHNDFVLLGPETDPAGARGLASTAAMEAVADAGAVFVSRGDGSGTEARELQLWERAGIEPGGAWYRQTGQGMSATLRVAAELGGYTLSDRATHLASPSGLVVLAEGDPDLLNVYHVIEMTARAGERVRADGAAAFADWITAPGAQERIGAFGTAEFGQPLFVPDAGKPDPTG